MSDFLNKLSSYNIFNYLFPGVLFAAIGNEITSYSLVQKDIVIGVFIYYFFGLVISRIGSIIIEPLLKWTGVIKFASYKDFISASQVDEKIELLSEVNNTYRSLVSLFVCLLALKVFEFISNYFSIGTTLYLISAILLLIWLFIYSYRKQSNYITQRILRVTKDKNSTEE
ncbi:MAG TPA: hypothetical protein ENJ28_09780 [Gammaproteobacteria bacterium]|nr:hypothetical protein [Gammaproteobacteria bacterium]